MAMATHDEAEYPGAIQVAHETHVNSRVRASIDDYLAFRHPPGAAILLDGAWGSGKTFLISEVVRARQSDFSPVLIVSLYGLTSRREIMSELMLARYPALERLRRRGGDDRAGVSSDGPELRALPEAAAFVFDDLERCSMHISEAMGFINLLVEREGRKVVILANEAKLAKRSDGGDYAPLKEKVVGRSFTIKPDFPSAFDSFVALVEAEQTADLLRVSKTELHDLFRRSEIENLRILQQTMWDFERVHRELEPGHRSNDAAMASLILMFFALSFELRAGRLKEEDLLDRFSKAHEGLFGNEEDGSARLRKASTRYPGVALHDTILSDRVLQEVLIDGHVDGAAIRAALDESSFFRREEEPSWRALWYAFERSDEQSESAAKELLTAFRERRFEEPGEILHTFGQMLKLSDYGVSDWDTPRTVAECRRYVDDLRKDGRLAPPAESGSDDSRYGSYAGLGFDKRGKPDFDAIWAYMTEQRRFAELDRYPEVAADLMRMLSDDPLEFSDLVGPRVGTSGRYATVPVLSLTDPVVFADEMIRLPPVSFNEVLQALSARYELGAFRRWLGEELPWAERLLTTIVGRAEAMPVFGRERINEMLRLTLQQRLDEARQEAHARRGGEAGAVSME